jgi:hypothetical protein
MKTGTHLRVGGRGCRLKSARDVVVVWKIRTGLCSCKREEKEEREWADGNGMMEVESKRRWKVPGPMTVSKLRGSFRISRVFDACVTLLGDLGNSSSLK